MIKRYILASLSALALLPSVALADETVAKFTLPSELRNICVSRAENDYGIITDDDITGDIQLYMSSLLVGNTSSYEITFYRDENLGMWISWDRENGVAYVKNLSTHNSATGLRNRNSESLELGSILARGLC